MKMSPSTGNDRSSGMTVDLSLNIVAHPVAVRAPVTPNPNKKNNKYERRRQRSNKTKKVNVVTKKREVGLNKKLLINQATVKRLPTSPQNDDEIVDQPVTDGSSPLILDPNASSTTENHTETTKITSNNGRTDQLPYPAIAVATETKTSVETTAILNSEAATNIHHDVSDHQPINNSVQPDVTGNVELSNSKRNGGGDGDAMALTATVKGTFTRHNTKQDGTPSVIEPPATTTVEFDNSYNNNNNNSETSVATATAIAARAAYMAEFHARPMELDRRAGVHHYTTSRNVAGEDQVKDDDSDCDNSNTTDMERTWEHLPLHKRLISAIHQSIGPTSRPTTIQSRAISLLLSQQQHHASDEQKSVFIHSETGSGKTLAYLLPVLQSMMIVEQPSSEATTSTAMTGRTIKTSRLEYGTRCVIICPTRELAVQSSIVCERMCRAAGLMHIVTGCLGGSSSNEKNIDTRSTEKVRLRKGLGIVVATPGRLLDHLKRTESLRTTIRQIKYMILDEVDRLLDSGLGQQVQEIIQIIQSLITTTAASDKANVPWRSVFVSATVTEQVQNLSRDILSNKDNSSRGQLSPSWIVVSGRNGDRPILSAQTNDATERYNDARSTDVLSNAAVVSSITSPSFADSSPKQLIQMHVTCSAKLRLTSLIAFLVERTVKGETTVIFVSTCASVDYYHTLLTSMDSTMPSSVHSSKLEVKSPEKSIFGKNCPIFKLHGNVPQNERQNVLNKFREAATARTGNTSGGSVLFATDVAARGLNLPSVDWIVQFDVPCDVADYVHRAGRVARAGGVGHALLFLLPSEKDFLDILQQRGIKNMTAMSLTMILNTAADICKPLTQQGIVRGGGSLQKDSSKDKNSSRIGEAYCVELQHRLEDCVVQDDLNTKAIAKKGAKSKTSSRESVSGKLIDMARDAFLSYIRAYPTKEKCVRHIFPAKALHLGHVARSFALKEPPKKVVVASQTTRKRKLDKLEFSEDTSEQTKKKHLSFNTAQLKAKSRGVVGQSQKAKSASGQPIHAGKGRSILLANAAKLQSNGLDGL